MSKIVDKLEEENAIRVAANMIITLGAADIQLSADAAIIKDKEKIIEDAAKPEDVSSADLQALVDARTRTDHTIARKAAYKIEFPKQKAKIKDAELQAEIDDEIAKL